MDCVLVTGGAGYIGSHTCKALFKAGVLPITYDNLSTGHKNAVKWGPFVEGDIRDKKRLDETFKTFRPKGVLHFAAKAYVTESVQDPGKYYSNNVAGSISLLESMRDNQIPYLVFSSTCATYGNPIELPIHENHPQNPISPYGRSKLMVERIIDDFSIAHDFRSVKLRYFNACGADLDLEVGEDHTPETHIIPSIIEAALGKRKEIIIYGNNYHTKDGTAIRDYIHVTDLADAHVKAIYWLWENDKSENINLGTGTGSSILEVLQQVQSHTTKPIPILYAEKRDSDPEKLVADNKKAKKLLKWEPKNSSLEIIVKSAWNWHNQIIAK